MDYPDEEYMYYICAKQFGWTINETDEQPAHKVAWLLAIASIEQEVENEHLK